MYRRLTHIGIAVKSIEHSGELFTKLFGMEREHAEEVADQKVKAAFFRIGGSRHLLVLPATPG